MSKVTALLMIALLLCLTLSSAVLSQPAFHKNNLVKTEREGVETQHVEILDESCEGVDDEEHCLMRRTLAAHLDYIYTQKQKP